MEIPYPKDMLEFHSMFPDEKSCQNYLVNLRWPEGVACPVCGLSERLWLHPQRGYMHCRQCRKDIYPTAGTVLHRSRLPLLKIFCIAWEFISSKQGVSAKKLSTDLSISTKVAWTWLHKFRRIIVLENRTKLSGSVEVDEVYIGGYKAGTAGRGAIGKEKVVIAVELVIKGGVIVRGMGRVRMQAIQDCGAKELISFIQNNVEKGSIIYTDKWKSYGTLPQLGYTHIQQVHTTNAPETPGVNGEEVTPNIHLVASLLKRWLLGTHQSYLAFAGYLQFYLDEYTFRYNRRKSENRGKLFLTLMKQVINTKPTTFDEITKSAIKRTERTSV